MTPTDFLAQLQRHRLLAVIRAPHIDVGLRMAQAAAAGGMRLIEITWTSHHPFDLVTKLRQTLPHCCIGAGTLLSLADLEQASAAGAEFGFAPYTDPAMLPWATAHGFPLVPGALTPTEIAAAWRAGAPAVKVFPITAVGGPSYLKHLRAPSAIFPWCPPAESPQTMRSLSFRPGLRRWRSPRGCFLPLGWRPKTGQRSPKPPKPW